MRAVICDIDGTLSDATHRLHHITNGQRNWDGFFAAMGDDPCHEPIRDLLDHLVPRGTAIVLCSGRPETYRDVTEAWLRQHRIAWDALYMRPAGDTRADCIVKAELLRGMQEDGYEPFLVIDDRPSVVAMWREQGLTCLQCRDWDERPKVEPGLLTIMVGPSGAGKTTWLRSYLAACTNFGISCREFGIKQRHVISSDEIREDLCGDFRSQERNDEVFAALHAIVKTRVTRGLPAVVDATNLRRKDRMAVAALAPAEGPVRYIVIDRPMEEKRRDAGWRAEVKDKDGQPFDLIAKHHQTFQSQLKDILAGDNLSNVEVIDLRRTA